jgi:formylglycine-generating enzyme required for sulfatase activity
MLIVVTCSCGKKFRAAETFAGKEVRCIGCGKSVVVEGERVSPYDIFISYSSKDKTTADATCAALEHKGFRCWVAPRDIVPGKGWGESIIEGIEQSRLMVLVFSANSNASQQVIREVERAVAKRIPIIPFRVENLAPSKAMEYFISSQHWLDAYTPPLEKHLEHLGRTVDVLLKGTGAPSRQDAKEEPSPPEEPALRRLVSHVRRPRVLLALIGLLIVAGLALAGVFWRSPKPTRELDSKDTNSLGMKFALIPAGEFRMGVHEVPKPVREVIPKGEVLSLGDDRPVHRVRITQRFYMGIHEVTVGQFRAFIDDSGYRTDAERHGGGNGVHPVTFDLDSGAQYTWLYTGFDQSEDHPVVNVNWNDTAEFCAWLSKKEGVPYRLPTEAEWEYACRAGSDSYFGQGDDPKDLEPYANLTDVSWNKKLPKWGTEGWPIGSWNDRYPFTAPVGMFRPNAFGLYDMHGNVGEWCADWYDPKAYRSGDRVDPRGPATGTTRVRRGSSWLDPPAWSGASARWHAPDALFLTMPDFRCMNYGFRVVKAAQP